MPRRLALVIALAVTVVVGFALLALGAVDFGSDGATTSGAEVAPGTADVAAVEQPQPSSGSVATPLPSGESGGQDSRETADHDGGENDNEDHEGGEHERFEEDDHEGGEREHEQH